VAEEFTNYIQQLLQQLEDCWPHGLCLCINLYLLCVSQCTDQLSTV